MKKANWIWMPHAGHFILGDSCMFTLNTYIGKYIVSTIGELWCDQAIRRIDAEIEDPQWYEKNKSKKGDEYDRAHFQRFGYEEIGAGRKYETMVFKAKNSERKCCPWVLKNGESIDFMGYNDAEEARKGHMSLCNKWSKK